MSNYYNSFTNDLNNLVARYPFITLSSIGTTVQGREIPLLTIGTGPKEVLFVGATHGMEHITSTILFFFLSDYARHFEEQTPFAGYDMNDLYNSTTLYVVPLLNPDGVELQTSGLEQYSRWQANANGVDINHNFNARWEECKQMEIMMGITGPGPTRYGGTAPESEPETQAITAFIRSHDIERLYSFHSQGEVIYWTFDNLQPPESFTIASTLSEVSGYTLSSPEGIAACGGLKDWYILELRRPGFTIEVGRGTNPLPESQAGIIYNDLIELLILATLM